MASQHAVLTAMALRIGQFKRDMFLPFGPGRSDAILGRRMFPKRNHLPAPRAAGVVRR